MKHLKMWFVLMVAFLGVAFSAYVVGAQTTTRLEPLPSASVYQPNAQEQALNAVYDTVTQSVVNINIVTSNGSGSGSGFVIDTNGHIVTNNHVIEGARFIQVRFADDTSLSAELVGRDPDSDLAVIRVNTSSVNLVPLELADSETAFVGQSVMAIGSPFGQDFTLTTGIVSAIDRSIAADGNYNIPDVIQTDAAINPGNSGGPLLDLNGRVIGVNTAILSRTNSGSGIGFAVPSNQVRRVVPYLIANGEYQHSWLGISGSTLQVEQRNVMELPDDMRGVMVASVANDGPAARAGLRGTQEGLNTQFDILPLNGDIITSINGVPIGSMSDLISYLAGNTLPNDTITMQVYRQGQLFDVPVTLGVRP